MDTSAHNEEERQCIERQIEQLIVEHRDLDEIIHQMAQTVYADQLLLKRLKKRKLRLKDRIEKLKSQLLPNILA